MQTVLIDTDIAIDFLRGLQKARDLVEPLWAANRAYLSILSVYELFAGMRENEKEDTENFIHACNLDLVTTEIALKSAELFRLYRKKGITLTSIDCLILGTSIIRGHKIATRNANHYPDKTLLFDF